jgi:hypothetical protein
MPVKTSEYNSFYRTTKKNVRHYPHEDRQFVDSVSIDDFHKIEEWMKYFGTGGRPTKINAARAMVDISNLPKHVQSFAELRFNNRAKFRKIYQMIQYRYSDLYSHLINTNWNKDVKWKKLAGGIISSHKNNRCNIEPQWINNKPRIVEYLTDLYEQQDGKCAMSNLQMTHDRYDENAVSVDRINSTVGYFKENIQLTCWWVNRMKFDLDLEDFQSKVKLLSNLL